MDKIVSVPEFTYLLFSDSNTDGSFTVDGKRKVQGVPKSQAAAHPRHEEEEETDKTK